ELAGRDRADLALGAAARRPGAALAQLGTIGVHRLEDVALRDEPGEAPLPVHHGHAADAVLAEQPHHLADRVRGPDGMDGRGHDLGSRGPVIHGNGLSQPREVWIAVANAYFSC